MPATAMNLLRPSTGTLRSTRIASLLIRPPVRHFHPTKPARLINEVLDASAGLLHGVHGISSLPWVASIPLTALIVRTAVGLPLQIYTRINARRERDLQPLVHAWGEHHKEQAKKLAPNEAKQFVIRKLRKRRKALNRSWGVSRWYRPANFLQVPIWLSIMESLRGMCGSTNGILPWLLSLFEPTQEAADAARESLHLTMEPSLATEGALWFPNLLAGDPTGILPAALAASILFNVRTGWKIIPTKKLAELPTSLLVRGATSRGLRLLLQTLSVCLGISCWTGGTPAALMIYWITSTNVATAQTFLLDKYMFSKPPLPPYNPLYVGYQKNKGNIDVMSKLENQ